MTPATQSPEFILMLTKNDATVPDALKRVKEVTNPEVRIIGFKDVGLNKSSLGELANAIRSQGRKVALEVVSLDEAAELRSVEMALALQVDLLLGGTRADKVVELLRGTDTLYFPFPGRVIGHPSTLLGALSEIVEDARRLTAIHGVSGLDLLAYRHPAENPEELIAAVVRAVAQPVIVAGSINSSARVASIASSGAWGFTVGSAALDCEFAPNKPRLGDQVDTILAARNPMTSRIQQHAKV